MISEMRKILLIGSGMVGMSFAYGAMIQGIGDELVLIDADRDRARGEEMDLNHGLAFAPHHMKIRAGDYTDAADADVAVICAGVPQKEGEDRIALLGRNAAVMCEVTRLLKQNGFSGIYLIATNPVDLMARVVLRESGTDPSRVIGSGTTLDSARLRYLLGAYFGLDPRNIHAYVIGEHGESEFVPWSQAMLATKSVLRVLEEYPDRFKMEDLHAIEGQVRGAAAEIIAVKRATYYGIGMSVCRIVKAILGDEHSILTVSSRQNGAYGIRDVYLGTPCVVGRGGVLGGVTLSLSREELGKLEASSAYLDQLYRHLPDPLRG